MRTSVISSLCALIVAAHASAAQHATTARRVSATIGLSKGAGALTCTFCSSEGKGGLAGMLSVETTVRPAMKLGLESDWWMHSGGGATRSVVAVAPVIHLYLSRSSPMFFKVGLGFGRFAITSEEEELYTTALSGVFGAAYEFRLANRNALIPYVSWVSGAGGTMRLNGALVTPYGGLSLLQYGIAFSKR